MSFAHHAGVIARIADVPHMALPVSDLRVRKSPDTVLVDLMAGHQAGPGGHTHRGTGKALAEGGALGGQTV